MTGFCNVDDSSTFGTPCSLAKAMAYVSNAAVSPHCEPELPAMSSVAGRSCRFEPSVRDGGRDPNSPQDLTTITGKKSAEDIQWLLDLSGNTARPEFAGAFLSGSAGAHIAPEWPDSYDVPLVVHALSHRFLKSKSDLADACQHKTKVLEEAHEFKLVTKPPC